jgi:pseudaminic acid biosynthesis-associated methylase
MNDQQVFWSEDYAQDYIRKNKEFDHALGVECWRKMLSAGSNISSILELGCNIGRNIGFLNEVLPDATKSIVEISKPAFDFATCNHSLVHAFNGPIELASFPDKFDLVFTIGVLIHIHPDNLMRVMEKLYDCSGQYILMGEYFNRTPAMIEYQGERDRLFKRDFGKLFIENFRVELLGYGFLWGHIYDAAGFDDITWWLFRKV